MDEIMLFLKDFHVPYVFVHPSLFYFGVVASHLFPCTFHYLFCLLMLSLRYHLIMFIEKFCAELKNKAKSRGLKCSGPVRMPTKFLKLVVRKSPCGEGTNTWDRFQMRIHKRILDLKCAVDVVKELTKIPIEPGIDVELTMDGN